MKNMKKIAALVLALVLVLSLTATAFAAETPNSNYNGSGEGDTDLAVQVNNPAEISITKDIVLYNAEGSKIYAPNVTYTYRVAPAGTTANSVDITGIILNDPTTPGHTTTTVTVRNGIAGGVKLANVSGGTGGDSTTITFANGNDLDGATPLTEGTAATTTNASAAKTSKNIYIQFDPATIYNNGANPAGIYRYKITDETTRATLSAAGILRDDAYDASYQTLYLDVYLKNVYNTATPPAVTGLEVYGYVLFKSGTANTEFEYVAGSSETYKLTGFNVDSELSGTTSVISDQYHTYNLNVTKKTTGALADKNNYFPFDITLTEATNNTATKVYVTYANATEVKDSSSAAINTATGTMLSAGGTATAFTGKIKDGGNIKFTGIPSYVAYDTTGSAPVRDATNDAYATANAKETNNTYDTYSATATVDQETTANVQLTYKRTSSDTDADTTSPHAAVLANTGDATLKTVLSVDGKNSSSTVVGNSIDFTNTLDAISPTGYVVRIAPYVLMLAAGIFFIILMRRRREDEEEAVA